jgi:hypothetical protein
MPDVGALKDSGALFEWRDGKMTELTLPIAGKKPSWVAQLDVARALPVAQQLGRVRLQLATDDKDAFVLATRVEDALDSAVDKWAREWKPTLAALARLPHLAHLGLGPAPADQAAGYYLAPSGLAALAKALPALSSLELAGQIRSLDGLAGMTSLRALDLRCAAATREFLGTLLSSLPKNLERLSVWLGGVSDCDSVRVRASSAGKFCAMHLGRFVIDKPRGLVSPAEVRAFIDALPASISELGLPSAVLDGELVEAIVASPRLRGLVALDLSRGTLDSDGADALIGAAKKLAHLERLDVRRNRLDARAAARLRRALPAALTDDQHENDCPEMFFRRIAYAG